MIWSNICIFFQTSREKLLSREKTQQQSYSFFIIIIFFQLQFLRTHLIIPSRNVLNTSWLTFLRMSQWGWNERKRIQRTNKCISRHPLHHFSYKHVKRLRSQFHFVLAHKAVSNWVRLHLTKFTNFLPERWCRMPRRNGDFPVERCRCIVWQALFWHLP